MWKVETIQTRDELNLGFVVIITSFMPRLHISPRESSHCLGHGAEAGVPGRLSQPRCPHSAFSHFSVVLASVEQQMTADGFGAHGEGQGTLCVLLTLSPVQGLAPGQDAPVPPSSAAQPAGGWGGVGVGGDVCLTSPSASGLGCNRASYLPSGVQDFASCLSPAALVLACPSPTA